MPKAVCSLTRLFRGATLALYVCAIPTLQAATPDKAASTSSPSALSASREGNGDCMTLGHRAEREACFAKESDADLKACERLKPNACLPYKAMFRADRQLALLNAELLARAKKRYASYAEDDARYLSDITQGLAQADQAWRAYRDAQCEVSPFLEGMSRVETSDLAEACRLELTQARIKELKTRISSL